MAEPVLVFRSAYGARNAFTVIASVAEERRPRPRMVFTEEDPGPLLRELEGKGYKPVVFYSVSTPVFLELREEIARTASRYPVVAGGPHAAGAYWQLLRLGVEAVVVGDGEAAVEGLLDYYYGEGVDLAGIPNIAFMDSGRPRVTRIVLVDLDEYKPFSKTLDLTPPIEIMRGCGYRCKFCQVPYLFKNRVRYRGLGRIAEAVEYYVSRGRKRIRFVAPVGLAYMSRDGKTPNPEALEALLRTVREKGGTPFLGTFPSETRPEQVVPEALEVLARYAGNKRLAIGLQSGSDRLLETVWRGHTVEEGLEAARLAKRYGFTPVVDILMGLPGETVEDVEATIKAMDELVAIGAHIRLHTFIPLPGTPLALAEPRGIHPRYRDWIRRMLGKGVLEGHWEEQERLAWRVHELMKSDPYPTPEPRPLTARNITRPPV